MGNLLQNVTEMHWVQCVGLISFIVGLLCLGIQWALLLSYDLSYSYLRNTALREIQFGPSNPLPAIYLGMALLGVGQLLKWVSP